MNKLWAFGDSYTYGAGCIPYEYERNPKYLHNYKKEGDDIWPNHLGKMLNLEVKNFGKPGVSNDYIIDSIIDQWDFIKENDYVIIGVTYHNRFDAPSKFSKALSTIFWEVKDLDNFEDFDREEMSALINFQYYFASHELYKKRHLKRINFLLKALKEKNIKTFIWYVDYILYTTKFEKIANATNGEIDDWHFSFKGHRNFADMVYKKLINSELI